MTLGSVPDIFHNTDALVIRSERKANSQFSDSSIKITRYIACSRDTECNSKVFYKGYGEYILSQIMLASSIKMKKIFGGFAPNPRQDLALRV